MGVLCAIVPVLGRSCVVFWMNAFVHLYFSSMCYMFFCCNSKCSVDWKTIGIIRSCGICASKSLGSQLLVEEIVYFVFLIFLMSFTCMVAYLEFSFER